MGLWIGPVCGWLANQLRVSCARAEARTQASRLPTASMVVPRPKGLETLAQPGGAGLLGKGRRGDGGDGELKVGDVALVAGKPIEEAVDARVGAEATDLLRERAGLSALGLPSSPGTEWHFRNDGTRGGRDGSQQSHIRQRWKDVSTANAVAVTK